MVEKSSHDDLKARIVKTRRVKCPFEGFLKFESYDEDGRIIMITFERKPKPKTIEDRMK